MERLNRQVMLLAWVLLGLGWVVAWAIGNWVEEVYTSSMLILSAGALVLLPATWLVTRVSTRVGVWISYLAMVGVITLANLAFDNPDLWALFFVLGLLRLVYKDSHLHLISPVLSITLYGLVFALNEGAREHVTTARFIVRLFVLFCFHAISFVINRNVDDIRARPARTALRLLGQYAIKGVRFASARRRR